MPKYDVGWGDYDQEIDEYVRLCLEEHMWAQRVTEATEKYMEIRRQRRDASDKLSGNAAVFARERFEKIVKEGSESNV